MMAYEGTPGETTFDPSSSRIEVVENDGLERGDLIAAGADPEQLPVPLDHPQPWHCRLVAGGNAEKTWWTEEYAKRDTARDALVWLGELFSPVDRATVYWPRDSDHPGYLAVWLDNQELGEKLHIPIRYVDERTVTRGDDA